LFATSIFTISPATSDAPFRIFNIGNNAPVALMDYITAIEEATGKKATIRLQPLQPGDVPDTSADVSSLVQAVDYKPATPVREGVRKFVEWYRAYYRE
jgi:UDP-glucuronate 4-epimerase